MRKIGYWNIATEIWHSSVDDMLITQGKLRAKGVTGYPQKSTTNSKPHSYSGLVTRFTHSIHQVFNDTIHSQNPPVNPLHQLLIHAIHTPYYYNHHEEIKER